MTNSRTHGRDGPSAPPTGSPAGSPAGLPTGSPTELRAGRPADLPTELPVKLPDGLPTGWHHLPILDVDRTVVIGPGGLFVRVTRSANVAPVDRTRPHQGHQGRQGRPWNGVDRRRPTSAQVTAGLVSQLVSRLCDLELACRPVVLLADDDTRLVARIDDVPVFHRRRDVPALKRRPRRTDESP